LIVTGNLSRNASWGFLIRAKSHWALPLPRLSKEKKRERFQKTTEKLRRKYES